MDEKTSDDKILEQLKSLINNNETVNNTTDKTVSLKSQNIKPKKQQINKAKNAEQKKPNKSEQNTTQTNDIVIKKHDKHLDIIII